MTIASLLDTLSFPGALKALTKAEHEQLAREIRQRLLEIGNVCGGHLASNLGVVELTLALHAVMDSPKDKIIWDTSHQTYVHKMLTGRLHEMFTIRQDRGLSGFAKIHESPHDSFGAGHASTALSAALGFAAARELNKEDFSVVAVLGDASLSGGMAFEALNNVSKLKSNFICVLNDNDMSISRPVGNMAEYITRIRTSTSYQQVKHKFERVFENIPKIGVPLKRKIERTVERLRNIVLDFKVGVIFEEFGFKYLGPIDGHNISLVMAALKFAKNYKGPIMIHIITVKGKGHSPAEEDPIQYHGVSPKKPSSLASDIPARAPLKTYSAIFGESVIELAQKNTKVVVVTPAMKEGSGLVTYANLFPDRFFDVGIAEEHAVTFAAGLARGGMIPILAIYSTFLQRGYDQLIHDVCLQQLPVIFGIDRAGLVGEDGPTHHGVFDLAYLLPIPHLSILAPKDGHELKDMMKWAIQQPQAVAIRYPRGNVPDSFRIQAPIEKGKPEVISQFPDKEGRFQIVIIAVGAMVTFAYEAISLLSQEGMYCVLVNLRFIKPLDMETLSSLLKKSDSVLVVEEGMGIGGVFHYIASKARSDKTVLCSWHHLAIPDEFADHGKMNTLREKYGLTPNGIYLNAKSIIEEKIHFSPETLALSKKGAL